MRKITFLFAAIILSFQAWSQLATLPEAVQNYQLQHQSPEYYDYSKALNGTKATGDTIWSEDFASGFPAGWSTADLGGNGFVWEYSTIGPLGAWTYTGSWPTPYTAIASTTGGNGFMLLNADGYNTDGSGNMVTQTNMDSYFQTDAINCAAYSGVQLQFQQSFRWCCADNDPFKVQVSANGVSWTDFSATGTNVVNTETANPEIVAINISSVAANQTTVYIRFYMTGASHYFWMVDDIAIVEAPNNDISVNYVTMPHLFTNVGFCSMVPKEQAYYYFPAAEIENKGVQNLTNVSLNVAVDDGSSTIFNITHDSIGTWLAGSLDTIWTDSVFYPPYNTANYTSTFTVSASGTDEVPANNVSSIDFSVTDSVFAHDHGIQTTRIGPQMYTGGADGDAIGLKFYLPVDDTLSSVSVFLDYRTTPGTMMRAEVYKWDNVLTDWLLVIDGEDYIIQANDPDSWVTMRLTSDDGIQEYVTGNGDLYAAMISCTFGTDTLYLGSDNSNVLVHAYPYETNLRLGVDWYYTSHTPMVRLNMYRSVVSPSPPVADFVADVTTVNQGGTVNFTDLSTNAPTSWSWSFTGGTPTSSTLQNPSVVYNTPGTYSVSLTAYNANGNDTEIKTNYITVIAPAPPVADFTADVTTITQGGTVNFTDLSTNTPTSWSWNFTGGAPASSGSQNPSVVYNTAGVYSVSLTAYNADGNDTEIKTNYITVTAPAPPVADFTADVTTITQGGTVNFTDLSTNSPTSWSWNFTGGTPASSGSQNPSVVYNTAGTYSVSLTAFNADGNDTEIKTNYITVTAPAPPVADFTADVTTITQGGTVNFTDLSTNSPTSWSWNFTGGTPTSSSLQNPSVVYNTAGTYSVSLTAFNADGNDTEIKTNYIVVTSSSTCNGTTTLTACPGSFSDGSDSSNYSNNLDCMWLIQPSGASTISLSFTSLNTESCCDFIYVYDGSTTADPLLGSFSGSTLPSAIVSSGGSMLVQFYTDGSVTDFGWDATYTCTSPSAPVADFVADVTTVSEGGTVNFSDLSANAPSSWSWSFAGGAPTSSTSQNPSVVYNTAGTYSVTLTATNAIGSDVMTKTNYITVVAPAPPVADFTADVTTVNEGGTVNFTDLSANAPTSWSWNFTGGTPTSSTSQNPSVVYNTAGTYSVSLTAYNADGNDTEIKTDYIIVVAPTSTCNGMTTLTTCPGSFSDGSDSSNYSNDLDCMWLIQPSGASTISLSFTSLNTESCCDFIYVYDGSTTGDPLLGSFSGSTLPSAIVSSGGSMLVQFYTDGSVTDFGWDATYTCNSSSAPVADFTADVTTVNEGGTVNFTDLSTNTPTSWSWTFAGGTPASSGSQNPSVVYTTSGFYTVELTATNSDGSDVMTKVDYIEVIAPAPPVADFTADNTTIAEGGTVNFTDLSTNAPDTWSWDFTGGSPATSTQQDPSVVYSTAGVYSVTLTATNIYGNNAVTKTDYITVVAPAAPVADFTADVTTVSEGGTVNFTDLSSDFPTGWSWTFTGASPSSSTQQDPSVVYNVAGTYSVTLTATNAQGSDTQTKTDYITVTPPVAPTADFTADVTSIIQGGTVNFTDLSMDNPTSWSWSFNGGSPASSSSQNPSVVYNNPGTYTVALTATNSGGSDTETKSGYITVSAFNPPTADFTADATIIPMGGTVNFTDLSSNSPTSWSWTLIGGTPSSSTAQSPSVVYNAAGTYDVSLMVTNADGNDTETKLGYIEVVDGMVVTISTSNVTTIGGTNGSITVDVAGNDGDLTYTLMQGATVIAQDGPIAQTTNYFTGLSAGTYEVQVDDNSSSDLTNNIVITQPTCSWFVSTNMGAGVSSPAGADGQLSVSINGGVAPYTVATYNNANGALLSSYNNINSGSYTVTNLPEGEYYVIVTDAAGCAITSNTSVIILDCAQTYMATAGFTYSVLGNEVTFTNTSANGDTYSWNFGNGTSSADVNPTVTYASEGSYQVTLTVTNECGTDQSTVTVILSSILEIAGASVKISPNPAAEFLNLEFTNFNNEVRIEVVDVAGRVVYMENVEVYSTLQLQVVDVSMLRDGMYFIKFKTDKGESSDKLIIE